MCCESGETLGLPAEVIEAVAGYRRLLAQRGSDWGDDRIEMFGWARFALLADVYQQAAVTGDWPGAIRSTVADGPPAGTVVVRVGDDRVPHAECGPARFAVEGTPVPVDVVVDSAAGADLVLAVAGREVRVAAGAATVETVDVAAAFEVAVAGGAAVTVDGAVEPRPVTVMRVTSPFVARWSVVDERGGAWFPPGAPRKFDVHGRPFFHARAASVDVPEGSFTVRCTRGLEYDLVEREVTARGVAGAVVAIAPPRLFDPAASGWYGGDLHVHLNYGGDQVRTPEEAGTMQLGEGLHLLNLVAANSQTSLVYDRELLTTTAGTDLPWSGPDAVARAGVEFRNDLLGHVHALGPSGPPARFQTGHERGEHTHDWPPNSVACADLRERGATIGYAHPAVSDLGDLDAFLAMPRSMEARELVADAALGLVDSVDVISPFDDEGAIVLYHRLLSCGLRLAATAGTDTFLSFSRLGTAANPPGWGRVYARLGREPLSVEAFQDAIRAGRTVVTNGPWLTLEADGQGPGSVLDRRDGDVLDLVARTTGPGVERLGLVGPDGPLAETRCAATDPEAELRVSVPVAGPVWIAAVARGGAHPRTLDRSVLAHTSPVHVEVDGARTARPEDARWCLRLIDAVQGMADEHGRFAGPEQRADLAEVFDRARAFYRAVALT